MTLRKSLKDFMEILLSSVMEACLFVLKVDGKLMNNVYVTKIFNMYMFCCDINNDLAILVPKCEEMEFDKNIYDKLHMQTTCLISMREKNTKWAYYSINRRILIRSV